MDERRQRIDPEEAPHRLTGRQLVLVLVGTVDRRLVPAVRFVSAMADADVRAVHVAVDTRETRQLAHDWMALDLPWLPLHIHDASADDVAASVVDAVRREAAGHDHVTVVVPELAFRGGLADLLHRRTGRRIAASLAAVPGVVPLLAPLLPA